MTDLMLIATAGGVVLTAIVCLIALACWRSASRAKRALSASLASTQAMLTEARTEAEAVRSRFAGVVDADTERKRVEAEIASRRAELGALDEQHLARSVGAKADHEARLVRQRDETEAVRRDYREKKRLYDRLAAEVAIFDERLAFAEMGVYAPHFEFSDSEAYKDAITTVRERQKDMVSSKTAVLCTTTWTVDGSASKGQTMTNRGIKLTLRAFNNECDAAISNTRWNNVNAMEKRIQRASEQIDKLNASNSIVVASAYLKLKLDELHLTHEYREKLKTEREERAEAARLAKEEQRLLRDLEQAQEEEDRYARLLAKAKAEAEKVVGPKLGAFEDQIRVLEKDLAEAHARAERAQAMAERTRSGYVYIISNIGSFGEGVVKIGLTRRLDPLDRVRELGDASVPFVFDTHAIIYSDDAPTLERALHAEFDATRINAQNDRKEFFRAEIDDVEKAVARLAPGAPFFRDVEAQEYRETLSRRQQALLATEPERELFPADL